MSTWVIGFLVCRKLQAAAVVGSDPNKQREYLKKKKQKKLQRFKELEEERESEKNKWIAFSTKVKKSQFNLELLSYQTMLKTNLLDIFTSQTTKKGVVKKSIFATPENVNGRVGIGTCGVSGKEMTKFSNGEKWRRGT